jgi:hypothetical protein
VSRLDRVARRLAAVDPAGRGGASLTRRDVVAGAAALGTAAVLGPLAGRAGAARSDDYCYAPCIKAAQDKLAAEGEHLKALIIRSLLNGSDRFAALTDCAYLRALHYASYYEARGDCKSPNCGDQQKYPPPPSPPPQPTCGTPCPSGSSCQPCPTNAGGGVCCLDIFPLVNGKSQCCSG